MDAEYWLSQINAFSEFQRDFVPLGSVYISDAFLQNPNGGELGPFYPRPPKAKLLGVNATGSAPILLPLSVSGTLGLEYIYFEDGQKSLFFYYGIGPSVGVGKLQGSVYAGEVSNLTDTFGYSGVFWTASGSAAIGPGAVWGRGVVQEDLPNFFNGPKQTHSDFGGLALGAGASIDFQRANYVPLITYDPNSTGSSPWTFGQPEK